MLTLALALSASAATLDLLPVADTMLCEATTESNGAGDYLFVGKTGEADGVDIRRALLRYDVAGALPAGATITSAELTINVSRSARNAGNADATLHRLNASWGEGLAHASGGEGRCVVDVDGGATWGNAIEPITPWSSPGGDFDPVASATVTIDGVGPFTWSSTAATVADAQAWLDSPGSDHGWLVRGDEVPAASATRFDSRENFNGGAVLTVGFDAPPLVLSELTPGVAGTSNDVTVSSAMPNTGLGVVFGFAAGSTAVPGCPGLTVAVDAAQIAVTGPADASGVATLGGAVGVGASGTTVHVQAVQPATCTVSNVVVHAFP